MNKWLSGFLTIIEKGGNALPHPATLFALFALMVIILSGLFSKLNLQVIHPGTGETVYVTNLFSLNGLHQIILGMVTNFTGFAPLGTVLVAMLGIGIAEGSGFIGTALRLLILSAPKKLLTFVIVFAGILAMFCWFRWGALFSWQLDVIPSPDWQQHSPVFLEVTAQTCFSAPSILCWRDFPKKQLALSLQGTW
jgi:hypothetical protein